MAGHTAAAEIWIPDVRAAAWPGRLRPLRPSLRRALVLAAVAGALGCSTTLRLDGDRYHHERRGYSIDRPDGDWRSVSVERSDLALRGEHGQLMSVSSRCRTPLASPEILARHLRIGMAAHRLRVGAPVEVDGYPGWMQIFDARDDASFVRVKTVTGLVGICVYDFVLVAQHSFPASEAGFDAWWRSFRVTDAGETQ